MKTTNIMEKIELYRRTYKIKSRYDLKSNEIIEIIKCCGDSIYNIIAGPFTYGYGQGYKAAMAEMKKKAREAKTV